MIEQAIFKILSVGLGAALAFIATKLDVTGLRRFIHRHLIIPSHDPSATGAFGVRGRK